MVYGKLTLMLTGVVITSGPNSIGVIDGISIGMYKYFITPQ
jgi:hypothetical protein